MLKTIKIILTYSIFAVMGSFGIAKAQNYPITSQPLLTPRFSLKWTDFYTAPNFFRLQLTLKDKDKTNVQVFLKLKLERVGLVIKTREDYVPSSPINLSFGSPTMLNGTDLVNYFSAENLEADGIDPAIFRQGGRLPDGFYTLTVTAFEFDATRGHRQVSNAGFTFMSNFYGYPPTITYPKEGQQLPEQVIQNTLFQWMPRATATQGGIGGLNYDFYLYELQDGDDANDIVRGKNVFFQGNTSQSSFLYGASLPQMIPGKRYAVQVRVSDIDQQNEYYNDGFSEVVSFTYGTPCVVPTDLAVSKYSAKIAKLRWTPVPNVKQYELAYKLKDASGNTWKTQTSYAYEAYATLENSVELYEFKVRSLCSNARTSDWSELVSLPSTPAIAKSEDPKARTATPLYTDPPSITNTTPIDKVLNPFDIPVSSKTITDDQINAQIGEIRDLSVTDNTQRCGYAISRDLNCDLTPLPNADTGIDFANPKGKYVYINGYEILVTRDAGAGSHTGEGLLYYPYLKTRIPVTWSGASIKKATDGDYGCLSPEVIAIGSQNGVVAADYRQQVIDLLTSGPHAYSGNLKGALAELKKVVADLNAGRTIDPAYAKSVIDAAQKGIEEWKTTVSKYFTEGNAPLPPEVQQILNSIEAIKTSLNAPKDCLAANIPPASPSGSKKAILFSLKFEVCTLSAEQKSVLEGALNGINENVAAIEKLLLIATKSPIGNWFTVGYQYFMPHNGIVRTYFNTLKLNGAPFGIEINGIDYYWDGISQYKKDTSWTSTGIPAFSPDVAPIIATSAPDIYYYYVYFPNGDCAYEKRTTDGTVQSSVSFDGCKSISSNSAKKPKNENVQCPVTPTTIEPTAFVDVFLHSERYIQCLTSLSIENRKILLNKILGSWATTDCLQNIDDPTIRIGNCYEPLCRNIILSTPPSQQKEILDYLKAQGLLDKIFKHLQLGTFDIVLKTLSDWIHQEYPKPSLLLSDYIYEDGSKTGVIDRTKSKYIRFTKNSVSASFANGKVTLHHDKECELIDRFCYETVPATDFTIDDPYSYVLVYFENDAGNFKKGNYYTIPAIEAHLIFNKDRRDLYITTGKIALEVGLLALGVGEFQAAYKAWQVGRGVYATYLATKATLDLGMGITDIYIQNELAEKWKREGQEAKLAKWNEINKWYIAVSFSVSVLDVAITKLGIGKTIDDETELNRLYDELTGVKGFVNRLESLNLTNKVN